MTSTMPSSANVPPSKKKSTTPKAINVTINSGEERNDNSSVLSTPLTYANRGKNFLAQEDVLAVQAYYRASEIPSKGSRQKKVDFLKDIESAYKVLWDEHIAFLVREIQASVTIPEPSKEMEIFQVRQKYCFRNGNSIFQRVVRHILPDYTKFNSILQQVT
jgi:hypothetical protein